MTDLALEPQLDWIDKVIVLKRDTIQFFLLLLLFFFLFHTHSKALMFLESSAPLPVAFSRGFQVPWVALQ